jgi:hypothetical protein
MQTLEIDGETFAIPDDAQTIDALIALELLAPDYEWWFG